MGDVEQLREEERALTDKIKREREIAKDTTLADASQSTEALPRINMRVRRTLKGHISKVYAMQWSQDSRHLVSISQDKKMLVWDAWNSLKTHAINMRSSWCMTCAYAPSGNMVACAGLDNVVSIYNLQQQRTEPGALYQELAGHQMYISCCRFINDNQMLTSSGDRTCGLWDIPSGKRLRSFEGHAGDVMFLSVGPSKSTFVSGSCDTTAKLWDLRDRDGRSAQTFAGHEADINAIEFFPDGQCFATGSDDHSCRLFDIRADQQVNVFREPKVNTAVTSVAFSGSGRLLFAGYDDCNCNVWDTLRGERVGCLVAHDARVSCLGVSPDGTALCTGSWDTIMRVWN